MKELFIPVKSLNEKYAVSELGNVKHISKNKIVLGSKGKSGYRVRQYKTKEKFLQRYVHHLVLEAFVGIVPKGFVTNHKDGNKLNKKIENLEIVTPKENIRHAFNNGLHPLGDHRYNVKILEKDIINIKELRLSGMLYREIAEIYNCSRHLISYICRGTRRNKLCAQ